MGARAGRGRAAGRRGRQRGRGLGLGRPEDRVCSMRASSSISEGALRSGAPWLMSGGGRETELVPTSEVENIMLKSVDVDKAKRSDKGSDTSSRSSEEDAEMML